MSEGHQPTCEPCGARGPVYTHPLPALNSLRLHLCDSVCPVCLWARPSYHLRGLCERCYNTDARDDAPLRQWPAEELMGEWDLLRREGFTVRQGAERLGITFVALDRALCRAKLKGDARAIRSGVAA